MDWQNVWKSKSSAAPGGCWSTMHACAVYSINNTIHMVGSSLKKKKNKRRKKQVQLVWIETIDANCLYTYRSYYDESFQWSSFNQTTCRKMTNWRKQMLFGHSMCGGRQLNVNACVNVGIANEHARLFGLFCVAPQRKPARQLGVSFKWRQQGGGGGR